MAVVKGDLLSGLWSDPAWRPSLSTPDWEAILGQARRARLLPRLANHIQARGWMDDVPTAPRRHLESGLKLAQRQHYEVIWEVDRVRRALAHLNTHVVLLKGAAYVAAGLPPAAGRLFSDIDIMVDQTRLQSVESGLLAAGWVPTDRDAYNNRYYRQWMHELPPMRHALRGTNLDVHHTITAPTSRFAVDARLLMQQIVPLEGQPGLFVLAPADMVLHSAAHLFQEGEFDHGLRDLLDMNDLVVHFSRQPGFWAELLARAERLRLQTPLSHALTHLARLFSTTAPSDSTEAVDGLDRSRFRRRLMTVLLSQALRPNHPTCQSALSRPARSLLYLRSHWLRMPPYLLAYHLGRKLLVRARPDKL